MYYDKLSITRETWKYTYTGAELQQLAVAKRNDVRVKEMAARRSLATLLSDPNVSQSDNRIDSLRTSIEDCGKQYEACLVYCLEFERNPGREFTLALGDVVYFGLI